MPSLRRRAISLGLGSALLLAAGGCNRSSREPIKFATNPWPGYDPQRPAATWMYRIALNVAISHVRSRTRGVQPESWHEDHHELADPRAHDHEGRQQVDQLYRFIQAQPPLDRALLLLYLEDHSYREMADVLGLSETNVATKISRLKQRLRQEL